MAQETVQLDIVLSNGDKAGQTFNQLTAQSRKLTAEIKKLKPGTEEFVKKSKDLQQVNTRIKGVKNEMYGTSQATKGVVTNFASMMPYSGKFQQLGQAIGGMKPALTGTAGASQLLGAAMKSIPIIALITGIASLFQWFKRTEKGAQTLRVITAGLGAAFDTILDVVTDLGEGIFNAFSNPKKAITELWEIIKTNLINRFTGLIDTFRFAGDALRALFNMDWDALGEAAAKAGESMAQSFTGIDDLPNKLKNGFNGAVEAVTEFGKKVVENGKAGAALADRENKLLVAKRDFIKQEADLTAEIAELRLQAADQTLSDQQRQEALSKAVERTKLLAAERTRLAQEEYSIEVAKSKLSATDEATKERINQLYADVVNVRKSSADALREIESQLTGFERKQAEDKIKAAEEVRKKQIEGEKALQDLRVELIEDTTEREIAKINLEYERKLETITGNEQQLTEQRLLMEEQRQDAIAELRKTREAETEEENFQLRMERLQNQFLTTVMTEQEFAEAEFQLNQMRQQEKVDLTKKMHGEQSLEYMKASNELLAMQKAHYDESLEIVKTTEEAKKEMQMATLGATADLFGVMASLMGEDEKARKKNAKAIKAFSVAQILANLYQEISGYFSNPGSTMTFGALGAIKAIAATARAFGAIAQVNSQKFALGGVLQGPKHSQGGIPFMNMRNGQVNEFEGDEIILTGGVSRSPWGRSLASNLNAAFGGRKFATGGPINPLAPASFSAQSSSLPKGGNMQSNEVIAKLDNVNTTLERVHSSLTMQYQEIKDWQRTIRVTQSLQDVETGLSDLNQVRMDSQF